MGGPGVIAISCSQHIVEAAEMLRTIKDDEGSTLSNETRSKIVGVLEALVEARMAAAGAHEEITNLSNYAEMRDEELGYTRQMQASKTQNADQVAPPSLPAQKHTLPATGDEREQAARLICMASFASAEQGFRSLDTFASWFVGGTAAALGLIIANFDKLAPHFGTIDLKPMVLRIAAALALVGISKFFGSLITTMAHGTDKVESVVDKWKSQGRPIPSKEALDAAHQESIPAPFRWLPARFMDKSYQPEMQARQIMRFLFFSGFATLCAVGLVLRVLVQVALSV